MTAPIPRDIPDLPALPRTSPSLQPCYVPARAVVPPVRRPLAAAYRLLLALVAAAAVTVELLLGSPGRVLSYFMIQSTIVLILVTLASARRAWTTRHPLPGAVTGAAVLYVTMAALIHHTLTPATSTTDAKTPAEALAAIALNTVIPIAAVLDWLLLSPPAGTRFRQAATWMLYPVAYLLFSLARGELLPGGPTAYLYPFLNVDAQGYKSVLANALLVGLSFYALAVLLVTLDHLRPNPVRRRLETGFRLGPPVG